MVGVASGDGIRRVLPSWMLGVSSSGQASKSAADVEGSCEADGVRKKKKTVGEGSSDVVVDSEAKKNRKRKSAEQDEEDCEGGGALGKVVEKKGGVRGRRRVEESDVPDEQKAKAPRKGRGIHEMDTLGENSSHVLVKCQTKRRSKSEKNEQGAELDGNITEKNGRGRRKVRESAAPNWQEAKDSSGEEREVELTAEDLVTIAEEYIKADRNVEPGEASFRECDLSRRLAENVSISNKLDDYMDSRNPTTRSLVEDGTNSKAGEEIAPSSSRTGDPAQDMLDLFLGPWLKKPVDKEPKTDILTDSLAFSYEIESQTHRSSRVVEEEVAPVTKKKTSLKDKVAMLLD